MNTIFGMRLVADWTEVIRTMFRLGLDLAVVSFVVLFVHARIYRDRELTFTLFAFNLVTFSLCVLLSRISIELGFALGIFAIFAVLRYRTRPIRVIDLTYLFVALALAMMNALAGRTVSLLELLAFNASIAAAVALPELRKRQGRPTASPMLYDRLELILPGRRPDLLADLSERTGRRATDVEVHRIDLIRQTAELTVHTCDNIDG